MTPSVSGDLSSARVVFSFSGEWRVFSGNELGALLGWWLFTCWKEKNQDPSALKDTYMLSSTVSSKILRAIALKEGFHFEVRCLGGHGLSPFVGSVEGLRHIFLFWIIPLGNINGLQMDGKPSQAANRPGKKCLICI